MPHYKDTNNGLHFLDSPAFAHMLPAGCIQISDKESDKIRADTEQTRLNTMTYSQNRSMAYPSFADQFDTIYHEGLDVWYAQIQAVKNKYPKE